MRKQNIATLQGNEKHSVWHCYRECVPLNSCPDPKNVKHRRQASPVKATASDDSDVWTEASATLGDVDNEGGDVCAQAGCPEKIHGFLSAFP